MKSDQNNALTIENIDNALQSITPEQINGALDKFESIMEHLITGCNETSEQGVQEKKWLKQFKKDMLNSNFNSRTKAN
ncbi:hypothetical protein [Aliivibrio salmonicida]|uniref:hypothetical protein n=1 Tax=Aliivibrio salmonicida TaxID=40269 RepID=UPI003D0CC32C